MTDRSSTTPPAGGPTGAPDLLPLTAIRGLDAVEGLRLAMGREALYRRLLTRFVEGQAAVLDAAALARAQNDLAAAVRAAHTLKGAAGQIGASDLQAAARAWETALQSGRDAAALAVAEAEVAALLGPLVRALCAALGTAVPPQTPPET